MRKILTTGLGVAALAMAFTAPGAGASAAKPDTASTTATVQSPGTQGSEALMRPYARRYCVIRANGQRVCRWRWYVNAAR